MTDDTAAAAIDPQGRITVALAALTEVTDPADVGALVDAHEIEPGVVDLRFATTMPGYVGWSWTVSTAAVGDAAPTVLEVELLPGEGALLAPAWLPWAERLAEWRRAHPDEAEQADDDELDDADEGDETDDDLDDEHGLDADDDLALEGDESDSDDEDDDDGDSDDEPDERRPGRSDRSF